MSTQATGNTCYFQTYLFALLCKVSSPRLTSDSSTLELDNVEMLGHATRTISRFLLNFFYDDGDDNLGEKEEKQPSARTLRPLTNSNFVIDFFRFRDSPYFSIISKYLSLADGRPEVDAELVYEREQYGQVMAYFERMFRRAAIGRR